MIRPWWLDIVVDVLCLATVVILMGMLLGAFG